MNTQEKQNNRLRIEGGSKNPTWDQITKTANRLARKELSPTDRADKTDNKLSDNLSYFQKNIKKRDRIEKLSYFCAAISVVGAALGIYTFVNINNPMSILLGVVLICLVCVNEYFFRTFTDKYADELFIFKNWFNIHLPKFLLCSAVTILITSGGYYKWNLEHHAPDPALLATQSEIKAKKSELITKQSDYDKLVNRSTVKDGKDKGRTQFRLEDSVNASTKNLESFKATIANLENKVRGKKVLDPNYQNKVFQDALVGAFVLFIFALCYMGCMFYMSYFDYRHYAETYPSKYLARVAKRHQKENF